MADVCDAETRSRMMAGVKSKDTKPERIIRRTLHSMGFRYRLHDRRLPGKPDLVFPKHRAVIWVHGCFWHGHQCPTFRWPKTRGEWWRAKIEGNRQRDGAKEEQLLALGWRVCVVWECATRMAPPVLDAPAMCARWLTSDETRLEIGAS